METSGRIARRFVSWLGSSTLDGRSHVEAPTPEVAAQVRAAQLRAVHELLPAAVVGSMVATLALYAVLRNRVPHAELLVWTLGRQLFNLFRVVRGVLLLAKRDPVARQAPYVDLLLTGMDGIAWGAMGWWLTPIMQLDVAVITLSVAVGVAAIGVLGLHVYFPMILVFALPITVPNAFYALGRQDDLGVFCCFALLGLTVLLVHEGWRSNQRILEMLRLRFENEQAMAAKGEALRQARLLADTKSRFVATMSHEMRTPLHGILGLLRMVRQDAPSPQAQRNLDLIQGSTEHMVSVINEVLDFSKMESGGLPVDVQPFRLTRLLQDLADTTRISCAEKGLKLDLRLDLSPEELVMGDATRVRQVMLNLLGNAIKFTMRGGIGLHARRDPLTGCIRMSVSDSGVGIPSHEVDRIFEPYRQAEGTYQRRLGGTGLGLAISRELCQAMGGSLSCRSDEGRGSVFVCELPLQVVLAEQARPNHAPPSQRAVKPEVDMHHVGPDDSQEGQASGPCVLLVDDNPVNLLVADAALQSLGARVVAVDSGQAALDWLAGHQPDVILMDCEMPGLDGMETTRQIRLHERRDGRMATPIVAVTGNGHEDYLARCVPAGMNDFLGKPFDPSQLREVLQRQLSPQDAALA
jgi:signal transduction histidine kinase/ActR/RegA family two-component response regulator